MLALGTSTAIRFCKQGGSDFILNAFSQGVRHFDTAEDYFNEEVLAEPLGTTSGRREQAFITTKFGRHDKTAQNVRESLNKSLKKLRMDYVDLYLVHDPAWYKEGSLGEIWAAMEKLKEEGLCRAIGVSNFQEHHIEELARTWRIVPSINQVEMSPFCAHDAMFQGIQRACEKHGIVISPYTSLAPLHHKQHPPLDEAVQRIGRARGMSDTQVLLAWALQTGKGPVVTATAKLERVQDYLGTFAFVLQPEELEEISRVGKQVSYRRWT
ncbi:NADP-dependent oxidoreductase domain-containing protein [Kockovaella imperatae]|uniref:NADP-dependent oxidoreductase domain-containing protein n=1 Tax=Kockovaella imperatae TaxID=4999 RepID=A0A1Y1UAJ6_9TREE|nr:NADP-dependent oxidoreductase domain-containing protein [Kockovaella imperatae]ORX35032.1 NADP-dependent oxidoreductase domain-containing protein [Kockovaella imperatae]